MAMGIVSDSDLQKEKQSGSIVNIQKPGRRPGDTNVPQAIREVISETSISDGRKEALSIANLFGVSDSSVSAYTRASTSTAHNKESDAPLRKHNDKVRNNIVAKAQSKIVTAIEEITEAKLSNLNAVECSQVARNLSGIVKDFAPELKDMPDLQQQLVIFAPFLREEKDFPVINAYGE